MENHEPFLREAIALSKSAMDHGDEPFGSVLVKDGEVILHQHRKQRLHRPRYDQPCRDEPG
ncbi:tRNA(Arg) A34 adenosine deaminase TadA [Rhizobium leguminosarum]